MRTLHVRARPGQLEEFARKCGLSVDELRNYGAVVYKKDDFFFVLKNTAPALKKRQFYGGPIQF